MGMPQLVVMAVLVEGRSKSEVARDYGVSRRWVITLVQRYLAEGEAGLQPRSRRPRSSPGQTPVEVEEQILAIRKELDRGGHDAGAETIAFHLQQRHGRRSTLRRRPAPRRRRRRPCDRLLHQRLARRNRTSGGDLAGVERGETDQHNCKLRMIAYDGPRLTHPTAATTS